MFDNDESGGLKKEIAWGKGWQKTIIFRFTEEQASGTGTRFILEKFIKSDNYVDK